jgi:alpha-L-fucosidase 2
MASSMNRLLLRRPASWWGNLWREALPSGNGKIGAAVYGGVARETILLNHAELWHGTRRARLPDVSSSLARARGLMDEGEYREADWVLANSLKDTGYSASVGSVLPLGDLRIEMPCDRGFKRYSRSLDMETGEVLVRWEDGDDTFERRLFVSRADDCVVCEIRSSGVPIETRVELGLHDFEDSRRLREDDSVTKNLVTREELESALEVEAEGEYILYAARNDDGRDFGAALRIICAGGEARAEGSGIRVSGASRALILVKPFVKGERGACWASSKEVLSRIEADYPALLEAHAALHGKLFLAATITLSENDGRSNEELLAEAYDGNIPNALAQKMWAYGRYLLISATRSDGLPCALYGLWCGDYNPMWCQNVANENIEMIYWQAAVGGLSELTRSIFGYYGDLMDDSRENARKLFGCRGIVVHAYTSPGMGLASVNVPVIMNWTGAAGWIAKYYYEYCLYTGDLDFMKHTALPFMREVAVFYEDFLVLGPDGLYHYYPSVSPENSPGNYVPEDYDDLSHPLPTTIDATMDFAIAKELLTNLIEGCRRIGVYRDEVPKWEGMLARMPSYRINGEGAVAEWIHPDFEDNYRHRHIAHLYPLFPGHELREGEDRELSEAFGKAVEKRLLVGLGAQSNWSLAHLASVYARLGEGDRALECLELLSRSCLGANFYTFANDWRRMGVCIPFDAAPFQIDANMGWSNAVQEMLFYSSPDLIKILPACPRKWRKGKIDGLHFCTGKISFAWDMQTGRFGGELIADRPTVIACRLPAAFGPYRWSRDSSEARIVEREGDCLDIEMAAGAVLAITATAL